MFADTAHCFELEVPMLRRVASSRGAAVKLRADTVARTLAPSDESQRMGLQAHAKWIVPRVKRCRVAPRAAEVPCPSHFDMLAGGVY